MARIRLNLSGQRFGRLTALEPDRFTSSGWLWKCLCDCGARCSIKIGHLRNGNTVSCGCFRSEAVIAKNLRHGLLMRGKQSPEFYAFINAKRRCTNPSDKRYADYGGRGIKFFFETYDDFIKELGPRPTKDHSLDRKNNDGHYQSGNIRWATRVMQQQNRRISL